MISRGRLLFFSISLITVLLVVVGSLWAATAGRQPDDGKDSLYKYLAVFSEVLGLVQRAYVDEAEIEHLMAGAFEGAADALDPFSLYVPSHATERYAEAREIGTRRSGLLLLKERGVAYAMAVEEGSPAAAAGIENGDIISTLQGESTRPMPLFRIHTILAGPVGTKIEMDRIHRGNEDTITFELAEYERPGVTLEEHRGLAVLRISAIRPSTAEDVALSLEALAAGAPELGELTTGDKLLVDLRGVAGGDEAVAYRVAGLFTGGELGVLKTHDEVAETFAVTGAPRWQGRLVLLLDRATQGAAEIVAAVLKQKLDATLVGRPSFGLAGRQSMVSLSNGGQLQITESFFTGPDREPLRTALEPDVAVPPRFDDDEDDDLILDRGLEVLLEDEVVEEKKAA